MAATTWSQAPASRRMSLSHEKPFSWHPGALEPMGSRAVLGCRAAGPGPWQGGTQVPLTQETRGKLHAPRCRGYGRASQPPASRQGLGLQRTVS